MIRKRHLVALTALLAAGFAPPAHADTLTTYGDTSVVGSNWQLKSDLAGIGWAGLDLQITGLLTPATLTKLSADYEMTQGTFIGGAPRFTLFDGANKSAWVYWGTSSTLADPNFGSATLNPTGNYADLASADLRVASNGFGGLNSPNTYITWAQFVAATGATPITDITLDLDGGWAQTQTMLVKNFDVNGTVYSPTAAVPLPAAAWTGGALISLLAGARFRKRFAS